MSADNKRIRQWLGFPMIEAEREANKRRPVQQRAHKPEPVKDSINQALLDGVVLQVPK